MPLIDPNDPQSWRTEWGGPLWYAGGTATGGYYRKSILPTLERRADAVIDALDLTSESTVWIIGGYGWLEWWIRLKRPGISVGTIDQSTLVRDRAVLSERDEVSFDLTNPPNTLVEGSDAYNAAMADLVDDDPKAPVPILNALVAESQGSLLTRERAFVLQTGTPDKIIYDDGLTWGTDVEAEDTVNGMLLDVEGDSRRILLITLLAGRGLNPTPEMNLKPDPRAWWDVVGRHPIMEVGTYTVHV